MGAIFLPYGTIKKAPFPLIDFDDTDFQAGVTIAVGDAKISKDGGAFANISSNGGLFVEIANGFYEVILSAAETQCEYGIVQIIDQTAPAEWEDQSIVFFTYGHASAFMPFDFSNVQEYLQADIKIDTTQDPWEIVWYKKGTATELMRKQMKDPDGNGISAANKVVGQHIHTT